MIIDELVALLRWDTQGEGELANFNRGLGQVQKHANAASKALNTVGVAVGTFVGTMASMAALKLADTIGSIPGEVIKTGRAFENYRLQLETLEGSSDKAEKAMGWIKQFAQDTPLEMADVIQSYASLKNFGIDPTNGSLMALVDAMAASGKGKEQLQGLSLALGQAWAKEKLQGEEILQMVERGIPVWELLSQATGKSTAELQKLVEKGKLGRKEIDLLVKAIGTKYKGASEKFAKSFDGVTSKLSDSWTMFLNEIAEGGIFQNVKQRLTGLQDYIDQLSKDGTLGRWAKNINDGMEWALNGSIDTVKHLLGHFDKISEWAKANPDMFGNILTGLKVLGAFVFPRMFALLVLEDILTWMEGKESVIGNFAKSLSELTGIEPGSLGSIMATLGTAGAAFLLFGGTFGKVATGVRSLALALGLMGGAKAAAGTAAMEGITGGGLALGLLGIAAAAGAAAASVKLFFDAWKQDIKLNDAIKEKVAPGLFDWVTGKLLGGDNTPEAQYVNSGQAKKDADKRKARDDARNAKMVAGVNPDYGRATDLKTSTDWRADEARKESDRARLGYGPQRPAVQTIDTGASTVQQMLQNLQGNLAKTGANATVQNIVNDTSDRSVTANTTVSLTVQQIEQAASAAASAVKEKVSGALKSVPMSPTRTTPYPAF